MVAMPPRVAGPQENRGTHGLPAAGVLQGNTSSPLLQCPSTLTQHRAMVFIMHPQGREARLCDFADETEGVPLRVGEAPLAHRRGRPMP